jgi:hypothetical protein
MSDPDPEHDIEQWTSILGVREWVDKKAYKECKKCGKGFYKGHQHHCRGCGEMFCSQCTSKFHVPEHLIGKEKKGPARMCFDCRDKCLMEREKSQGDVLTERKLALQYTVDPDSKRTFIHPPLKYLDPKLFDTCGVCRAKIKSLLPCASCGDAVCDDCLSGDVDLPKSFKPPKGNSACKLCKQCRFYYFSGAQFVVAPPRPDPDWAGIRSVAPKGADAYGSFENDPNSKFLKESAMKSVRKTSGKSSRKKTANQSTKALSGVNFNGPSTPTSPNSVAATFDGSSKVLRPSISFKAIGQDHAAASPVGNNSRVSPTAGAPSPAKTLRTNESSKPPIVSPKPTINLGKESKAALVSTGKAPVVTPLMVRWEGEQKDVGLIDVKDGENLQSLFHKIKVLIPSLGDGNFSFSHNGIPIRSEHWALVEAKKLFPIVHLKRGVYDYLRRSQPELSGVAIADFEAETNAMLSLKKAQNVSLVKYDQSSKWWYGCLLDRSKFGWFPQDRVKILEQ